MSLTEGSVCKGGQNPPNDSDQRPDAPGGSGALCCCDVSVLPLGSNVELGPLEESIPGRILGVAVYPANRGVRIQYQVSFWNGRTRSSEWLDACEVRPAVKESSKYRIGFSNAN